jgi:hypothetical protein
MLAFKTFLAILLHFVAEYDSQYVNIYAPWTIGLSKYMPQFNVTDQNRKVMF